MGSPIDAGTMAGAVATRQQELLAYVIGRGNAQIEELAERFAISRMTIHRDIQALAAKGLLRKVHGGVSTLSSGTVETSVLHRTHRATSEKKAIARLASQGIEAGQIVVLDDSTTAALLADHVMRKGPLTVITNSLGIGTRLSSASDVNLISLGGRYHPTFDAFFGNLCELSISALRANTLFMSVSAVHGVTAFHQEHDVIKAKLAMMEIVERRVLMVDSMKFDVCALNRLAPLAAFDEIITDVGISPSIKARFEDAGLNLTIASSPAAQPSSGMAVRAAAE